ncbi:hypothetical protein BGZ99_003327 [Dissophora globulifera]|uniref:Uncharacterized protein n=1 Tax=Dissophora globulifera TaxID=979702 RepID=A0A9P6RKR6_9FUNG|nr:hypothetical protein BGZ99_003327 [Dissophora globulifera]
MDGVDCDWCLVCEKHTAEGETYCSEECRSTDLMSSSASSSSSSSSAGSAYFNTVLDASASPATFANDHYPMPPFVRKQRTSIPNIYAQCTSNPNPPPSLMFTTNGNAASALSHHLLMQQQQQQQQHQQHQKYPSHGDKNDSASHHQTNPSAATAYPLFYATLNALRPSSPSGPH